MLEDAARKKTETETEGEGGGAAQKRLLESRSILLYGEIDAKTARTVVTQLLVLNQISREEPIRFYVNSPGGWMHAGFAIYDMMRFVDAPVITVCTGLAASAGTLVMLGGEKGKRFALPHARIMLHQPSWGTVGTAADIDILAREVINMREKANELYARETGQTLERIRKDLYRDFWMSAEGAKEYGLIDGVVTSEKDLPKA